MAAPYAYVVEYRAADACFPPDCRIDGRRTFGRASDPPAAGGEGAYVMVGSDRHELFAKRGVVLHPAREIRFTLPAREEPSVIDMSLLSANAGGGPFRAVLEVQSQSAVGGSDAPLLRRVFEGATAPFETHREVALLGREDRYFTHVREALPARATPITVVLRNEGATQLGVGAPLVLRRVEGRGPRQAFLVVFDAVPYPLFEQLYATRDERARWISSFVAKGTLFPQAITPGQLTGSFVRRFFRGDYYRLEGDPSLAGQGFDETAPERALGPVARLAEQGFHTEAIGANLYLSPILSRIGFDSDYNIEPTEELQIHPQVLAARFAQALDAHGDDDALFVIWYANTHFPWLEGRRDAPLLRPAPFEREEVDLDVLEPIWRNLFDAVESLRSIVERARTRGESAARIWILTADHGHTFTLGARGRPWRLTKELVSEKHMHCCLATQQEARTPLAVIEDGALDVARARASGVSPEPISTLAAWRAIERRLGVDLDLPETSAFALPTDGAPRFDDGIVVSVGNSGALFGRHGSLSYHALQPALRGAPAWEPEPRVALLLRGSPVPVGGIPAEELYEPARDPAENDNLAAARFGDLLDMRSRMSSWLAEYGDGPDHERYAYTLAFDRAVSLDIVAPRAFLLETDGKGAPPPPAGSGADSRRVAARVIAEGKVFRFLDENRPLGVVDLAGPSVSPGVLVRCGSSGLPLARIDGAHPRLNLALARTNCVGARAGAPSVPGEAIFQAELLTQDERKSGGSAALPELKRALERWGYVRER
ncbi:MAG TPA: hypothetical protein VK540_32275 [Polyangiaceae bacterium]|nr:hypothetical protein [Polyangiaceae bacterium]